MVDAERGGFCGEPEDSRRNPTTAWAWLADLGRRTTQATRSQSVSSVRFSDSWSRCLRAPKASRLMPVASSIAVMARHAGPVLVDTNIILESYRVGSWRALAGGYGVQTVEECVDETQAGSQRREPERRIDEVELRGSLAVGHSVGSKERAELAIRTQDIALDPGEASLWAHARSRDDRTTRRS